MSGRGNIVLLYESDRAVNYALERISLGKGIELRAAHLGDVSVPADDVMGVLLDDQLLVGSGDDSLIGTIARKYDCPVIVMTQSQSPRMAGYLRQMGAAGVLSKPFRMGDIRRQVWQALHIEGGVAGKAGDDKEAASNVDVAEKPAGEREEFSPAQYGGQVAGDEVFDRLFGELERRQPLQEGLDAFDVVERHLVQRALVACHGNQSQAARFLGITRNTLRKRIRKYGFTRLIAGDESSDTDEA